MLSDHYRHSWSPYAIRDAGNQGSKYLFARTHPVYPATVRQGEVPSARLLSHGTRRSALPLNHEQPQRPPHSPFREGLGPSFEHPRWPNERAHWIHDRSHPYVHRYQPPTTAVRIFIVSLQGPASRVCLLASRSGPSSALLLFLGPCPRYHVTSTCLSRAPAGHGLLRQIHRQGWYSDSSAHSGAVVLLRAAVELQA